MGLVFSISNFFINKTYQTNNWSAKKDTFLHEFGFTSAGNKGWLNLRIIFDLTQISPSEMFKLLIPILPYFFFIWYILRSPITMGIVRILIFASLVAGTFGFFWPSWDLADQRNLEEKTAYLEELCENDDPYCFRRCSGSGAFGLFCRLVNIYFSPNKLYGS